MYHLNHGSKTGVLKRHLDFAFLCLWPASVWPPVKRHRNSIGLETSCSCQCSFIDSYNLMSEKDRKMWYRVNFPKFLETRIWGHRAMVHKVTKAFCITASSFRILRRPIVGSPQKITSVIKAAVVLYNFLMANESTLPLDA